LLRRHRPDLAGSIQDGAMIHVCSLARLNDTVASTGARHVVSLLGREDNLQRPPTIARENHLWLQLHDISGPLDGYVAPELDHVEQLITFIRRWPRDTALVMHCYAGVSRSTAAAFVSVCALEPQRDEHAVALALRRASPTATPNPRIVALADAILGRNGRMIAAVAAIGPGMLAPEALPFRLEVCAPTARH
jgi:predicted protein tyrosine phosphatase